MNKNSSFLSKITFPIQLQMEFPCEPTKNTKKKETKSENKSLYLQFYKKKYI